MAESNVYIITSGASSKIGVASNVDSRFRSYSTHNPNAEIHRVFPCSKEIAQRTEAVVKAYFANRRSGRSLEWFEATPYELEKCITNFLAAATTSNSALSRSALDHGLVLPQKGREMLYEIGHLMRAKEMDQKLITAKQNEFCEYFGQAFNLGVPEHRLSDYRIVGKDDLYPDVNWCNVETVPSYSLFGGCMLQGIDHPVDFYTLKEVAGGCYMAFTNALVSMPYMNSSNHTDQRALGELHRYGLVRTQHHEWSWYYPGASTLWVYQQKTPIEERLAHWPNSFRKWVIERAARLRENLPIGADICRWAPLINDICAWGGMPLKTESLDDWSKPAWDEDEDEDEDKDEDEEVAWVPLTERDPSLLRHHMLLALSRFHAGVRKEAEILWEMWRSHTSQQEQEAGPSNT